MISIGLDIGSVAAKGVLLQEGQQHLMIIPTGWSPRQAGEQLIDSLLQRAGYPVKDVHNITVTGYGRVALNNGARTVTEIKCHARGVAALYPQVRTIIDIGGQDSKVIQIDSRGRVIDFVMNDKCAAGTGRFLQVTANALGLDVSELSDGEKPEQAVDINSMCTVFAESEIIGLLAQGVDKGGIIAGLHRSVARKVAAMVKRLGIVGEVAFTGGVAMNRGIKRALEQELGCTVIVPEMCQYTGALGAALIGSEG
ncbi:MAG TPA: acyl-CoA dehydratase activase [Syntrophomonadaceae bacterium]|nr:2-hydroxyglutaryl-CoA dehydratase [Syntrophomonadaceae bacterium]HOQ09024.1 acyl-CoA dehydratase activase [Syntrophomonadaceae bacterium]HPU47946.1 acyl-CoA dehydratase activase [Syntrophomonadaceae bacterium]